MPDVATRHPPPARPDMTADSVTITVPVDGYEKVVRLVSAGLASRLGFGFESVDDLQLAIELVLRSVPSRGGSATVQMTSDGRALSIAIAPVGQPDARAGAPAAGRRGRRPRCLARAAGRHCRAAVRARKLRHPRQVASRRRLMRAAKGAGPASEVERRALLRAYRENGDLAARDRLVEGFMPLVSSLARRYAGRGEQLEDLEQVASLGLMKAIERFDLDREVDLVTYIFPTVVGELKRHFRDRVWSVTVPRRLKELYQLLSRLLDELTAKNGRQPTIPELAAGGRGHRGRGRRGARGRARVRRPLADRARHPRRVGGRADRPARVRGARLRGGREPRAARGGPAHARRARAADRPAAVRRRPHPVADRGARSGYRRCTCRG